MAYRLAAIGSVHTQALKNDDYWRRVQTIRQGIVIGVIFALTIGVFFGIVRLMNSESPAQAAAGISSTTHIPAVPDEDDHYEDDVASQNDLDEPASPPE